MTLPKYPPLDAKITPVLTTADRYPWLKVPVARPDHRGKRLDAQMTATEQYEAIRANAMPRGGLDRPVRSRADADRAAARQAAEHASNAEIDAATVAALRVESAALRELVLALVATIEALGATVEQLRLDVATLSGSVA